MEIGLGDFVSIIKDSTVVTGLINGLKLDNGQLERVSFECIDQWFYMDNGWAFVAEEDLEEEDAEV